MKLEEIQTSLEGIPRLKRTASGPDELPNWLFRDFAYDLALAITDVFKSSLRQHKGISINLLYPASANFFNCCYHETL